MEFYEIFSRVIWRPGIGDNTWWGWGAVVLYYAIALVAGGMAWYGGRRKSSVLYCGCDENRSFYLAKNSGSHSEQSIMAQDRRFFTLLALFFFLLGIVRQTGLLRWFTNVGRTIAWKEGWYLQRTLPQQQFIQGIYYGTILLLVLLLWLNREALLRHGLVLLGVAILLGYLAVRTVSLHSVDFILMYRRIAGLPLGAALELGSQLFVGVALLLPIAFHRIRERQV